MRGLSGNVITLQITLQVTLQVTLQYVDTQSYFLRHTNVQSYRYNFSSQGKSAQSGFTFGAVFYRVVKYWILRNNNTVELDAQSRWNYR